MADKLLYGGGDFFAQMAAREPYSRRMRRLFERGVIVSAENELAVVNVGRREDGTEILLEEVPIVSGYNPQPGDWVALRYEGGHGGAPMVFGPSVAEDTEAAPSTSSAEVIAARSSGRHGAYASLDGRLEAHEQTATDPHGSALTQTAKVVTPLVEGAAGGDLVICPAAGRQALFGVSGGDARPVLVADAANQARPANELLRVAASPTLAGSTTLAGCKLAPVNTNGERAASCMNIMLEFSGANLAKANSEALGAGLVLNGGAAMPAPTDHPMSVCDLNLQLGGSFSGSAVKLVGVLLHPMVLTGASGTASEVNLLEAWDGVLQSGVVGTLTAIKLPDMSGNVGTYRHMDLATGTIYARGDLTCEAGGAGVAPWTIKGASGQTADLLRLDVGGARKAVFDSAGNLGIGLDTPDAQVDVAAEGDAARLQTSRYGGAFPGVVTMRQARGTLAAPAASQNNDQLGHLQCAGHNGSQFVYPARISFYATQNYSGTANGAKIIFWITKNNTASVYSAMALDSNGYLGIGQINPSSMLEVEETQNPGSVSDGYAAAITLDPGYSKGSTPVNTVTRHNYIDIQNPSLSFYNLGDACVFRFDAAAGTHKAVDSGTTKATPGSVDAWLKVNINGTIYYLPAYTSKTT